MAVLQPKNMYRGSLGNTASTLYTAPANAGSYAIVKEITLCNFDTVEHTVSVYNIESAGSVADNRKILSSAPVEPGGTVVISLSSVLGASDTLRAVADTAASVTAIVSGVEYAT